MIFRVNKLIYQRVTINISLDKLWDFAKILWDSQLWDLMSSDGIKLGLMRFVMVSRVLWFQRSEERCFLSKNHSWKHITIVPTKSTNECYIVLLKYTPSWVSTCQMCFPGTPPNLPEVMATSPLPLGNHLSCLVKFGVSIHGNNPKWTVYSGKTYQNRWFGGTPISGNLQKWVYSTL